MATEFLLPPPGLCDSLCSSHVTQAGPMHGRTMQERWGLSVQAAKVAGFEFTAAGDHLSHHTGVA